jgi:hypothetical protein
MCKSAARQSLSLLSDASLQGVPPETAQHGTSSTNTEVTKSVYTAQGGQVRCAQ